MTDMAEQEESSVRRRVADHRARMRLQGLRPVQIWVPDVRAAGFAADAGKPRPVLIVQNDLFDETASVTVCPMTTDSVDVPLLRIPVEPDRANGLSVPSRIMVDKVTTMPKAKLGERIGRVSDTDMVALSRGLFVFLGLAVRNND